MKKKIKVSLKKKGKPALREATNLIMRRWNLLLKFRKEMHVGYVKWSSLIAMTYWNVLLKNVAEHFMLLVRPVSIQSYYRLRASGAYYVSQLKSCEGVQSSCDVDFAEQNTMSIGVIGQQIIASAFVFIVTCYYNISYNQADFTFK